MKFSRMVPRPGLEHLIECYWMMESDDPFSRVEKIIPDGFTELIFNYGSVYRANIKGLWYTQTPNLLAGQISRHFYLENTADTASFAIKLKPAALTQLFGLNMQLYIDQIVDLDTFSHPELAALKFKFLPFENEHLLKQRLDEHFLMLSQSATENPLEEVLKLIFDSNGMATISALCEAGKMTERQMQRLFKKYVGISPKYYARIIRFNYIFQLIQKEDHNWADIVYQSGYYDQSHFIRNFKAFTGEDPSDYFFEEINMANFFLRK
ncbi:helix-turn-helix domain-containing protein [Pedobacter frigoris]|uniref:AraC family transcriptional regulator n=1 Tax=Pedobacter frigoris TaxID=2571272 RepID=A0A4U1CFL1_9SPHI|nr:helix-turn-helix domain-containing protein [Pedobacter frigoris]TKC05878.1 AraC family transcriptional regulator [Pedobacter frigoris]